ncbi:MAG TPA: patatin-like phospholipase family protein [Candidatus Omnitrophota bacterium]|nr:patatin-like phospholipase family protein [Candidatus Omnitrophota bacterium]
MKFLPFNRKFEVKSQKDYAIQHVPIFSELSRDEKDAVSRASKLVDYKKDDFVFEEGAEPVAFYVVVSGLFRLTALSKSTGIEKKIVDLYPGDHFGETSILTGNLHRTATARAKTDGVLIVVAKEEFEKLIKKIPALSLQLNRSLGRRLIQTDPGHSKHRREVHIASVLAMPDYSHCESVMRRFTHTLRQVDPRKVIFVDLTQAGLFLPEGDAPDSLGVEEGFDIDQTDSYVHSPHPDFDRIQLKLLSQDFNLEKVFSEILTHLTYRYDYMMLLLPDLKHPLSRMALHYSDRVYLWGQGDETGVKVAQEKVISLKEAYGFSRKELKLIFQIGETREVDYQSLHDSAHTIFIPSETDHPTDYERVHRYLAKEWSRKLVGLALGSGAAYGLAHIGVLKVLEREGITVDVISGSSIGSLIGTLWAAGYSAAELEKLVEGIASPRKAFFELIGFFDFLLPHHGFFRGDQICRFLAKYLGQKTFQDLNIPTKVVAVDLYSSQQVIFESGRVLDAVRASISIPGVFKPFPYRSSHLIDGGVLDPLPVRTLVEDGIHKIIAVNVLPSPGDRVKKQELDREHAHKQINQKNPLKRFFAKVLYKLNKRYSANVFNVLMNTIQFMEYEMVKTWANEADVYVHAVVPEGNWIEFFHPQKFINEGEKQAQAKIQHIKQLVLG